MFSAFIVEEKTPGCYIKARFVLALMGALGILNAYSLRSGINVAVVAMVTNQPNTINSSYESECKRQLENISVIEDQYNQNGEFEWTIAQQTLLLGCFYYGYVFTNIPGAWLSKRFGFKMVFGLTSMLCSVLTLLIPVVARTSFALLVALRIITGVLQGVTFPTMMTAWGVWSPPLERSRMTSSTLSGLSTGYFVSYIVVGLIISAFGWEAAFYSTGALGVLWSTVWLAIIHDTPAKHPRISAQERNYIEMSIHGEKVPKDKDPIPWWSIAKSLPVWATVSPHLAENWATFSLGMLGPTYLARVHTIDLKLIGLLSAIPFAIRLAMNVGGSVAADFVLTKGWARIIVIRKAASIIPLSVAGTSLVTLAYLNCYTWPAVALICISAGILGLTSSGHESSFVDIAPRYSGVIYSLSNTLAAICGFAAPQIAGAILIDNSLSRWRAVFCLSAGICAFGAIIFIFFGSDQVQPWARYNERKTKTKQKLLTDEQKKAEENSIC